MFYEAKCLECHARRPASQTKANQTGSQRLGAEVGDPHRVTCPVNPDRDCLSCHMPKVETDVPNTMFTDHHIRVNRPRDRDFKK